MGIHSGKFYDARKMRDFCDSLKQAAADFDEKATATHANYNSFYMTEAFMGMTADEAKNFVKNGLGNMLKTVSQTHKQMVDTQTELITMFEEMVDPSQNARIEYDTLDKINRDFKEMYYIYKDSAERVRRIVNNLNAEFGSYAYFEQPDSKSGLDAMIAFCGGEDETAGYIKSCQNKLVAYDEAAKAKLNSMDTIEKATKVDTCITDTRAVLSAMPMRKSDSSSTVINCVDNTKATKSNTNKNIKKNEKEEMYDYLKEYYGFSDEEMEYLKENYPELLSTLYNAQKTSTNLEMRTYEKIKKALIEHRVEYTLESMGWNKENLTNKIISEITTTMMENGIDTKEEMCAFLAECSYETKLGTQYTEQGSDEYFQNKAYGKTYRGGGAIQITWEYGYQAFATYEILKNYPELKKYGKYLNPANNSADSIATQYENIVNAAKENEIEISKYTRIVTEGANYVGAKFAWESAGYFWSINKMNDLIDDGRTIDDVSRIVNKNDTATFDTRKEYYQELLEAYDECFSKQGD